MQIYDYFSYDTIADIEYFFRANKQIINYKTIFTQICVLHCYLKGCNFAPENSNTLLALLLKRLQS